MSNFTAPIFDSLIRRGRSLLGRAAQLLPQHCALCGRPCADALVCEACDRALPRLGPVCPRCALPIPGGAVCGRCLARPPPWDAARAAFLYAYPLDQLLQAMKYRGVFGYADFLAGSLARTIVDIPDAVIALPLAPARQRERGFNQAQELARRIARIVGSQVVAGLVRVRDSPAQAALPWRERRRNVRNAFAALPAVAGLRVAVVDDVLTTGATLTAATQALRRAGARGVAVWVVARTLPPSS
jgi:ComF family protein